MGNAEAVSFISGIMAMQFFSIGGFFEAIDHNILQNLLNGILPGIGDASTLLANINTYKSRI